MSKNFQKSLWRAPLWERQVDPKTGRLETERAYAAFTIYLEIPIASRSLRAVDAALRQREGRAPRAAGADGKQRRRQHVGRWLEQCSSKWEWQARAYALLGELDRRNREAQIKSIREETRRVLRSRELGTRLADRAGRSDGMSRKQAGVLAGTDRMI